MMLKFLPISPFVGAILLLACAKSDPVADNAVAPSDAPQAVKNIIAAAARKRRPCLDH